MSTLYEHLNIEQLRQLLGQYQGNLAVLMDQRSQFGNMYVPLHITNQIKDTIATIELIAHELRHKSELNKQLAMSPYNEQPSLLSRIIQPDVAEDAQYVIESVLQNLELRIQRAERTKSDPQLLQDIFNAKKTIADLLRRSGDNLGATHIMSISGQGFIKDRHARLLNEAVQVKNFIIILMRRFKR